MPQLDIMHFFSQFFWFSVFFILLFFYINFNILPLVVKILKYRSKKLIFLSNKVGDSKKNVFSLCLFYDEITLNSFKITNKKVLDLLKFCNNLVQKNFLLLSKNIFLKSNKNYFVFLVINIYKNFIFNKKISNEL